MNTNDINLIIMNITKLYKNFRWIILGEALENELKVVTHLSYQYKELDIILCPYFSIKNK